MSQRKAATLPAPVSPADAAKKSAQRRHDRYRIRSQLSESAPACFGGSVSSLNRVRRCGKYAVGNLVGVRVSDRGAAGKVAGFAGLEMCGSGWACPVCAAKVAAKRCEEVTGALTHHTTTGQGSAVMITLTMRHDRAQRLGYCWDNLTAAWKAATNGTPWRNDRDEFGVIGYTRITEVTHGANGWHVHVHALLFLDDPNPDPAMLGALGSRMFGRWRKKLRALGMNAPVAASGGLDVRPVYRATDLGAYLTKFGSETDAAAASRSVALEATRGDLKEAKNGNRTPWQILGDFLETGDCADLGLWQEYEQASKGRRRITWTRAPKDNGEVWAAVLAARGEELTDEEIAAQDHGGETIGYIDADDWRAVIRKHPQIPARVLSAAETSGFPGIAAVLSAVGVGCWAQRPHHSAAA